MTLALAAEHVQLLAAGSPTKTGTAEAVAFWILAPIAVIAAGSMLVVRKAVHSALLLAVTMICLAVLYLGQGAPFLGVVQVVVYTGAVMMLFLFVLMLVGVDSSDSLVETLRGQRIAAVVAGIAFAVLLLVSLGHMVLDNVVGLDQANAQGNVEGIAVLLFTRYAVVFEVTAALLITATLAGMVLTHQERHEQRPSQRELAAARFRPGGHPAPLPAPGVYARHNAVDTPALLPDGSPSPISVPAVLGTRGEIRASAPVATDVADVERGIQEGHDDLAAQLPPAAGDAARQPRESVPVREDRA